MNRAGLFAWVLSICVVAPLLAQQNEDRRQDQVQVPIYRIVVEQRAIRAINYGHRTEPTKIDFRGTVLLPQAKGGATVTSRAGAVEVDSKFEHLDPPTRFGRQYLTYVLWAITPDGRPVNLGEVLTDGSNKGKLKVTTALQSFGLLVTAEPYFAVTQPSNLVVLENVVRPDTAGKVEEVEARYELLNRGGRQVTTEASADRVASPSTEQAVPIDQYEAILALREAQNALQIAESQGASRFAGETLSKAKQLYDQAQQLQTQKGESKRVVMLARESAQTAHDASSIAMKHAPPR